jgi:hypothetical protein
MISIYYFGVKIPTEIDYGVTVEPSIILAVIRKMEGKLFGEYKSQME